MSNKNKSRLIKRLITGAMVLTLVFSINGFASVVSDNDGSAFITKAEFDSLKNNFQSQIDQYNQSIDSKIDGAIAAYLAGIQVTTTQILSSYINSINPKFSNDPKCGLGTTTSGTYAKYFINIGLMHCMQSKARTLTQVQFLTGAINNAQWKTVNESDPGRYGYGTLSENSGTTDATRHYKIDKILVAKPNASVAGSTTGGNLADYASDAFAIPSKEFKLDIGTSTGASNDTWEISLGGKTRTINVVKNFGNDDTFEDVEVLFPGVETSTDSYAIVLASDVNKVGERREWRYNDAYGYEIRSNPLPDDPDQSLGHQWIKWHSYGQSTDTKLAIYKHYFGTDGKTATHFNQIVSEKATAVWAEDGVDVFLYQGVPICKNVNNDGSIKFKLQFTLSEGSSDTYYMLQKTKFTDTDIDITSSQSEKELGKVIKGQGATFEHEWVIDDVKKGEALWIKVRPSGTGTVTVKTSTDIILTKAS